MALQRRSRFGFPPPSPGQSQQTVRLVPLTHGMQETTAWPLRVPGSAMSMTNFLPLEGKIRPRSRLSSVGTIAIPARAGGSGMAEMIDANGVSVIWVSGASFHARFNPITTSISQASFVSTNGIGPDTIEDSNFWQYARAFSENLGSNGDYMLVAAGGPSHDTLLCLYLSSGAPLYSYLTGAPMATAVANFDNYIVAWNILVPGVSNAFLGNRAQWCVRGEPFNWSGEGSGFEDILEVRGDGTAARGMSDGRLILFSNQEIWYGVRAAYPAQFQFFPLDRSVGCVYARTIQEVPGGLTIQEVPGGLVFLGSDWRIRLLPTGGGATQVLVPDLAPYLRLRIAGNDKTWALYDAYLGLYRLFIEAFDGGIENVCVVNPATGEWGFEEYTGAFIPHAGVCVGEGATDDLDPTDGFEGVLFSTATYIYSTTSLISHDTNIGGVGSVVTSTWRSPPLATDFPANWKQLLDVNVDYRATSLSTLTLKISIDGGNNYETTGRAVSLTSAPFAGRATSQVYQGGAFPTLELTSTSTGYELHRLDVTMDLGGRRNA